MRRLVIMAIVIVALLATGCAESDVGRAATETTPVQPTTALPEAAAVAETTAVPEPTPEPTATAVPEPTRVDAASAPDVFEPGPWVLDLGSFEAHFTSDLELDLGDDRWIANHAVWMQGPESSRSSPQGLSIQAPRVLIGTNAADVQTSRFGPTTDLDEWIASIGGLTNVESGDGAIGDRPARWWRFDDPGDCESCFRPISASGDFAWGTAMWGSIDGSTAQIWSIDVEGLPVLVSVGAETDRFDEFLASLEPMLATLDLRRGSVESPSGTMPWAAGEYAIGRAELEVSDPTRPVTEVVRYGDVMLENSDTRDLLVSVGYPATGVAGFGATPAEGYFPLIVVAHSLGGDGLFAPPDEALVATGYVVARVRFPESSGPVREIEAVREQPADVSVTIDALLGDALPPAIAAIVDPDRIGVVGFSMGGTTVYGLLGADGYRDGRIAAAVAHAPSMFDFDVGIELGNTPLLLVSATGDGVAGPRVMRDAQALRPDAVSVYVHQGSAHLDWMRPHLGDHFGDTNALTRAWFDRHLKGSGDIDATAAVLPGSWEPAIPVAEIYTLECASCHGLSGEGTDRGPDFSHAGGHTVDELVNWVRDGRGEMPAFGAKLTDVEIAAVIDWVLTEFGGHH